ncbi:VWA domain-containing protein [Pseudorhodobacter sp. W20_MBD10_FR17]|uniref:VWA domain-containing protein n=1 Tax=Pseudorhodobacter sp. W20_MBD10_FR17 TaxID=3240266 RepID=UPI003F9A9F2D
MIPTSFHLLRPEWLLAFFPAAMVIAFAWHQWSAISGGGWAGIVDTHLMPHLAVQGVPPRAARAWVVALGLGLGCMVLAMAGPAWQKLPVPVYGGVQPTVVVLSLSQSMNSTDLVPSRMARAGHKLRDILDQATGGDVALVIYADRPFVATPLTSDAEVIRQMLPELSTGLMPVLGNRLDLAIDAAQGVLSRAGAVGGRIVVLADDTGLDPAASLKSAAAAKAAGYDLGVLGVGTADGADLQTAQGHAIRAQDGSTITAKLDLAGLRALAQAGGGAFSTVTADGSDLAKLLPAGAEVGAQGKPVDLVTDSWDDMGYWLLFLPLLLAPFAFRRGLLFVVPFMIMGLGMAPQGARADTWADLWKTPDQQGQAAFAAGDFKAAATAFANTDHKASALYRAGDFDAAAQVYAAGQDDAAAYNLGNALAKAGQFEKALAAYDKALAVAPKDADTLFNRDLVAKLLQQQKQDQQKPDQDQKQSGDKNQDQPKPKDGQGQPEKDDKDKGNSENQQSAGQQGQTQPDQRKPENGQNGQDAKGGQPSTGSDANNASGADGQQAENGQDPSQNQSTGAEPTGGQGAEDAQANKTQQDDLKDSLDKALAAKDEAQNAAISAGEGQPADQASDQQADGQAQSETLDQATEQQLRAVPDDPSGLLRARIRQYYTGLRAAGQ